MSKVVKGEIVEAQNVRTGFNANGKRYVMFGNSLGKDSITIFSKNPDMQIQNGDTLRVVDIETVLHKITQTNGKWYNQTSVVAVLERAVRAEENKRLAELGDFNSYDVQNNELENTKSYEWGYKK